MNHYEYILKVLLPKLQEHDVKLVLDWQNNSVKAGEGLSCSGYFDHEAKVIAVAIGSKDLRDWFSTLIHEFCHFEQWIENCPEWEESQKDGMTDEILDNWLGTGAPPPPNMEAFLRKTAKLEYDCEKRATEKLKYFTHIIDTDTYTQKANAYIGFYRQIINYRKWYAADRAPYLNETIWKEMPSTFLDFEEYWENYQFDHIHWENCL